MPTPSRSVISDARFRLPVDGEVLQGRHHVVGVDPAGDLAVLGHAPLQAAHRRDAHARHQVRVLAVGLLGAAPARIAQDVDDGRQRVLRAASPRLLAGWGALLVFFFVLPLFLSRAGRAAMGHEAEREAGRVWRTRAAALIVGTAAFLLIPSWHDLGVWLGVTLSEVTGIPILTGAER